MIISLEELLKELQKESRPGDTLSSEALWVKFAQQKTRKTVEYRTPDENIIVHIYLNENDALVGVEIFP